MFVANARRGCFNRTRIYRTCADDCASLMLSVMLRLVRRTWMGFRREKANPCVVEAHGWWWWFWVYLGCVRCIVANWEIWARSWKSLCCIAAMIYDVEDAVIEKARPNIISNRSCVACFIRRFRCWHYEVRRRWDESGRRNKRVELAWKF